MKNDDEKDCRKSVYGHIPQNPLRGILDAERDSAENIGKWPLAKRQEAEDFESMLKNAYPLGKTYLNYRERFIAVKVTDISEIDSTSQAAANVRQIASSRGYEKTWSRSTGSVIYRIK